MTKLLSCPFCGQQDAFVEQLDSDASVVICQGMVDEHSACLARGPVGVQQSDLEDQPGRDAAIAEWNLRAQPAEAEGLAHELWAAAQLAPGEGISDGVARLAALIGKPAEAQGVDFGFDDRSVKVSQEAYSIFLEREQHHLAALSAVTAERDRLQSQLAETQANDRAAMGYLHDVRQLVGGSDFPEMVRNVARMVDALPGCVELIEALSPIEGDVLRKARAAMAAKEA